MNLKFSVRNILAIVLTVLAIVSLFWPSMIRYTNEAKEMNAQEREYMETQIEGITPEIMQTQFGFSESDAKMMLKLYKFALATEFSFNCLRDMVTTTWKMAGSPMAGQMEKDTTKIIILSIAMNVLFFGMIAAAAVAIVLYLLNRSRIGGIIFAVLAVLGAIAALVYILYANSNSGMAALTVGASMFILPIFAIAACILYKKEAKKEIEPAEEAAEA